MQVYNAPCDAVLASVFIAALATACVAQEVTVHVVNAKDGQPIQCYSSERNPGPAES
jgi:hypothetical protein